MFVVEVEFRNENRQRRWAWVFARANTVDAVVWTNFGLMLDAFFRFRFLV